MGLYTFMYHPSMLRFAKLKTKINNITTTIVLVFLFNINAVVYAEDMVQRKDRCIACGSKNIVQYPKKYPVACFIRKYLDIKQEHCHIMFCRRCGMVFFNVGYTNSQATTLYTDYKGAKYNKVRYECEPWHKKQIENLNFKPLSKSSAQDINPKPVVETEQQAFIRSLIKQNVSTNTIFKNALDYGGGGGPALPDGIFTNKYIYDIGGEPPLNDSKFIREIKHNFFNFVMASHVLEHLTDPLKAIDEIKNSLVDGGLFYVEVPMQPEVSSFLSRRIVMHEHINFYSPLSLILSLENNGFKIISYGAYGSRINFGEDQAYRIYALAKKIV